MTDHVLQDGACLVCGETADQAGVQSWFGPVQAWTRDNVAPHDVVAFSERLARAFGAFDGDTEVDLPREWDARGAST